MSNPIKAILETSHGEIELELDLENAPVTVANFVDYAKAGFYSDTVFHRVINGFMIQGGGHLADMSPKKTNAPIKNESKNGLKNERGTIAMARTNDPDSATAQFFINLVNNEFLNPRPGNAGYAVFGKVVTGMDVVDAIAKTKTGRMGHYSDVPSETITIRNVRVTE